MTRLSGLVFVIALLLGATAIPSAAQDRDSRFGIGLDLMMAPPNNSATGDGIGVGFRSRFSVPITYEVSFAVGGGLTGSIFRGRTDAKWTFNPQASLIVTIPNQPWAPYVLAGPGIFVPIAQDVDGGPALHAGIGWARLLTDASVYIELNPSLVIGETTSTPVFPLRAGVIF